MLYNVSSFALPTVYESHCCHASLVSRCYAKKSAARGH